MNFQIVSTSRTKLVHSDVTKINMIQTFPQRPTSNFHERCQIDDKENMQKNGGAAIRRFLNYSISRQGMRRFRSPPPHRSMVGLIPEVANCSSLLGLFHALILGPSRYQPRCKCLRQSPAQVDMIKQQ